MTISILQIFLLHSEKQDTTDASHLNVNSITLMKTLKPL